MNIPPDWFVEPLNKLATACYQQSPKKATIVEIVVGSDFGLILGIAPGETMKIATPVGYVEVRSDDKRDTTANMKRLIEAAEDWARLHDTADALLLREEDELAEAVRALRK
jgi:hypothetical protein